MHARTHTHAHTHSLTSHRVQTNTHTHIIHIYILSGSQTNQYNIIQENGQHIAHNGLRWAQLYIRYYSIIHANLRWKDGKKPQIFTDNSISYSHMPFTVFILYIYLSLHSISKFSIYTYIFFSTYLSKYMNVDIIPIRYIQINVYTTYVYTYTHSKYCKLNMVNGKSE